jgi:hypothetical protein
MQAITHNLAGILIQIFCFSFLIFPFNVIFTIILGIVWHFLLDLFVNITYHTPEPQFHDKFWVTWHIIIFLSTVVTTVYFFIPFFLGMLSANLVDIIDWIILRGYRKIKSNKNSRENKKYYYLHDFLKVVRDKLMYWMPDWKYRKLAIIPEIILIIVLIILIFWVI